MSHTPTPWKVVSAPNWDNGITYTSVQPVTVDAETMSHLRMASGEYHVCRMTHTAAEHKIAKYRDDAAFIVKAVNSHDRLVEALQVARALMLQEADVAARAGQMARLEAGATRITAALEGL